MGRIEIVPSILSADVGRLAEQVKEAYAAGRKTPPHLWGGGGEAAGGAAPG